MKNLGIISVGVVIIAFLVIIGPLLTIWSLNTLFNLTIPFTLETWAAAGVLSAVVSGGLIRGSSK